MTRKTNTDPMLRGSVTHRRTQSDYLRTLLDRVTLETWGDVVEATVTHAKEGDAQARAFLASYLVGRPAMDAPSPLAVMVQAIGGDDPLVSALAEPAIDRFKYPTLHAGDEAEATIKAMIADELPDHLQGNP
ncbi:hypothetical protein AB7849_05010 [Rhodanobacter sp. 115]|uniref:hypothetical protein n=1 Tax=Rhodanobacter sp. FW021-MT20 TaxID=1162282 RepID=UPI000260CE80|nr:hypothetical protein [Rhodanobacter sp. 115]EIL88669.1 hypothetical protein UU5_16899 [Rhodanobacter sp. 115]